MSKREGYQWKISEDVYMSLKYFPSTMFKWRWCLTRTPFPVEEADWIWWLPGLVRINTITDGAASTKLGARFQIRQALKKIAGTKPTAKLFKPQVP